MQLIFTHAALLTRISRVAFIHVRMSVGWMLGLQVRAVYEVVGVLLVRRSQRFTPDIRAFEKKRSDESHACLPYNLLCV